MSGKLHTPFGRWPSRITPHSTGTLLGLSEPAWNVQGDLFWRERKSRTSGIQMADHGGGDIICLSPDTNVGGGLLYGGGSFGVSGNRVCFIDKSSGQLTSTQPGASSFRQHTSTLSHAASPTISPDEKHILFAHSDGEEDGLYLTPIEGKDKHLVISNSGDFFNYPRWHPSGNMIAWISWNQPHMPWDNTQLWLGEIELNPDYNPVLHPPVMIAGGEGSSVLQPEFSPDGKYLAYLSDQSGWWQIHLLHLESREQKQLTTVPAEHSLPPWLQNRNSYGFSADSQKIYFLRGQDGIRSLWVWDLLLKEEREIILDEKYTWFDWFAISPKDDRMALIASASNLPDRLITLDPDGKTEIIRRSSNAELPRNLFSLPKSISWKNPDESQVKGLFYPPHNPEHDGQGPPPLLVTIHSGPTRQKFAEFSPRTQFFTSRGFAVLEVNYRGSSGYGRAYRQSLEGQWGVADVEDCLTGALYVTRQGWADRSKMALLGSSSGGLTVYQIMVRYPGVFQAGIVLYGIVNHLDLLNNPTKFERYYSEWLIGPNPEYEDRYRERSPIFFADRIQDPMAVFHGGRDPIVPKDQADQIITALAAKNIPHLYQLYPDEGHGFKGEETLSDFYQQSMQFLQDYLFY